MGFTTDKHQRAGRVLQYALTLGTEPGGWEAVATVFRHRLTALERACVLASVIGSMEHEDVSHVLERLHNGLGMPMPPLLDPVDDATWWADHASLEERMAVLVAAFASLSHGDQQQFLAFATRRIAA